MVETEESTMGKILCSSTLWEKTVQEKYEMGINKEGKKKLIAGRIYVGRDAAILSCLRAAAPNTSLNV